MYLSNCYRFTLWGERGQETAERRNIGMSNGEVDSGVGEWKSGEGLPLLVARNCC